MTGAPFPYQPYPSAGPTGPPPKEHRTGDIVVTVVELVVLGLGAVLVTALVALVGFIVEAGDTDDRASTSTLMAVVLVPNWGIWLVAVVVSVVLMVRKRLAFWVPLVALVLWVALVLVVVNT